MTIYVATQNGQKRQYLMGADLGRSLGMQASPGPGVITFDFDGRTSDGSRLTGMLVCPGS